MVYYRGKLRFLREYKVPTVGNEVPLKEQSSLGRIATKEKDLLTKGLTSTAILKMKGGIIREPLVPLKTYKVIEIDYTKNAS